MHLEPQPWDGRISSEHKEWAFHQPDPDPTEHCVSYVIHASHPGLVDLFMKQTREMVKEQQRPSVIERLQSTKNCPNAKEICFTGAGAMSENRTRPIQLKVRVNQQEKEIIRQKMQQLGTSNMGAYLRKMAIDGYVLKLDMTEMKEMVSLLRRISSNVNQIAKRANETGRVYETDLEEIQNQQEQLWTAMRNVLQKFIAM